MKAVRLVDPHIIYDSEGAVVRTLGTDMRFNVDHTCDDPPGCVFHGKHLVVSSSDGTRLTLPEDNFRPVFRFIVGKPLLT